METPDNINTPSIAKNTLFNFLFRGTGLFFGFVTSIVIARLLGPEKLGEYSLAFWILTLSGFLVNLGLPTTVTKYISEYYGKKDFKTAGLILKNSARWIFWAGVLVTILLFFFSSTIANLYQKPYLTSYLKIGALGMIPLGLLALYMAGFSGFLRYDFIAYLTFILSPLTFILILLALVFKGEVKSLFWVTVIANLLGAFLYFNFYHSRKYPFVKEPLPAELRIKLIHYSRSIFLILLLEAFLWERFELLFLGAYSTEQQVGFYNLGFNLANKIVLLLPGALAGILLPTMSEAYGGGEKERLGKIHYNSTRYLALLAFPLCSGGIFLSSRIISTIYGNQYLPSALIFSVILLAGTIGALSQGSSSLLYSLEKQKIILRFFILSVFLKLGLNLLLTPRYQALGAVWVSFSAQAFFGSGILFYVYAFYLKEKFPFLSILKILFSSALMGIIVYLLSLFLPGVYGIIICILVGAVVYLALLTFTHTWEKVDLELSERYIQNLPFGAKKYAERILGFINKYSSG